MENTNTQKGVIITGCLGGIGKSIVKELKNNTPYYSVIGIDMVPNPRKETINNIDNYFYCDLEKTEDIYEIMEKIFLNNSNISHLINNAGIMNNDVVIQMNWGKNTVNDLLEKWKKTININLTSCYVLSLCFSNNLFKKRTRGSIINISSISSNGNPGQSSYSSSKGALRSLSKTLSKELGPLGIRSNVIIPGFIETKAGAQALPEKILRKRVSQTPLKRLGMPEEVSKLVRHLIENEFLNGSEINLDGGLSL